MSRKAPLACRQFHAWHSFFDRARRLSAFQGGFDLEAALQPFMQYSAVRMDLRQMFLEVLIEAAFSSGAVSQEEADILRRVARRLHIPGQVFAAMMNARSGAGAGGAWYGAGGSRTTMRPGGDLEQAYAKLGLKRSATDAEVKKAYRRLVSQYHPDKLVSRGLPEEMMEIDNTRTREINTAYDVIKQARGVK